MLWINLINKSFDERPLATATDMRENSALGQLLKNKGTILAINGNVVSLDRLYKGRSLKNL